MDIRFLARAVALAGTVVAVSVCGEQGTFGGTTGPSGGGGGTGADATPPSITIALGPTDTLVELTDSLKFTVTVTDAGWIKKVHVEVAGLGTFSYTPGAHDTTFAVTSVKTFSKAYTYALPTAAAGQRVNITVSAEDGAGNPGLQEAAVRINDAVAPVVTMVTPSAAVYIGAGDTLKVLARAVDPSGIRYLGARLFVRDSALQTIQNLAPPDSLVYTSRSTSRLDTFRLAVPQSLAPGSYLLHAFAADSSPAANVGYAAELTVNVRDVRAPGGSFVAPALDSQIVAGDSVLVRFRALDSTGVTSVAFRGYSIRGDSLLGTDTTVLRFELRSATVSPSRTDTTVGRWVRPVLSDSTAEAVYLEAAVTDVGGNVARITRRVQVVPGANVRLVEPAGAGGQPVLVPVGTRLQITVAAYDPDTLAYLGYVAAGRFPARDSVQVLRPVLDAVQAQNTLDFWVPLTAPLGVDTLRPFARDRLGNAAYGAPVILRFVDNSQPLVDIIRPDSAGGDSIPVTDSLQVRVRTRDDQGVEYVSLLGRWNYPALGDSTGWHRTLIAYALDPERVLELPQNVDPVEFSKFRVNPRDADTTIVRYLHPTATLADSVPHSVWIVAYAEDSAGNVGVDSVLLKVTVGASVRLLAPTAGAYVPMGSAVSIILQSQNPLGIDSVGFYARGGVPDTTAVFKAGAPTSSTDTLSLAVPVSDVLTADTIIPYLVRGTRRITGTAVVVRFADTQSPTVTIDSPSVVDYPITATDSVFVQLHATDNRGVTQVVLTGVARRGSVSLGTDETVTRYFSKTVSLAPTRDTTITRHLIPVPTDRTSEIVYIIATVSDSSGNTAADTTTVRIVGGPVLSVLRPVTGASTSIGKSVIVEIRGVDPDGTRLIGWRATGVVTAQDSTLFSPVNGTLADTAVFIDTLLVPAGTAIGNFAITPFGLDSLGDISGTTPGVVVAVQSSAGDVTPPSVRFSLDRRVEVDDSVTVTATDAGGLKRLGFRATLLDTTVVVGSDSTTPDLNGTLSDVTRTFSLNLPITIRYPGQVIIRGFAVDSAGNRAVSSVADTVTVVAGKTYALPAGSQIADAIYNQRRRELYLSNFARDQIEVFSLQTNTFVASIPVGSRPWGLALWPRAHDTTTAVATDTIYADTLIVANSGGTNLSIVDLVNRVEVRRHALPNYRIEAIKTENSGAGGVTVRITPYDLSDRPQYIATVCRGAGPGAASCDSVIAIYSTTPTPGQTSPTENRGYLAWENLSNTGAGGGHMFWEHAVSGGAGADTTQIIAVRPTSRDTIVGGAAGVRMNLDLLTFQDTTYVRNSGNFLRAVIGEGGGGLALARVMTYNTGGGLTTIAGRTSQIVTGLFMDSTATVDLGISTGINVQDFIGNRASKVTAVAANFSGTTNLVRADSIYVFNTSLRQTGMLQVSGAAHGMDVAPLHVFSADARGTNTVPADGDADARIVFAARPDSSIDVFDTYFFGRVTDTAIAAVPIPIRNALVGAVRVTPDLGGTVLTGVTNQGLVVIRLPTLTNPFPVAPMPLALPTPVGRPPRARGASPPNE